MKITLKNKYLGILNEYQIDNMEPINISYLWNLGSLLGLCLVIEIISGIALSMHYTPNINLAFASVEHITRDVNMGWMIRYVHANTASFFFIAVYIHIARGLYYGSYKSPRGTVWTVGVTIYQLMMQTAFQGYTQPYGQMSYWGIVVITSQISVIPWIGFDILHQIWGGLSVENATLNRLFSLHFQVPFIIAALVIVHLVALHEKGSNNPMGIASNGNRIPFHVYYTSKDLVGVIALIIVIATMVFWNPNQLGHPDNNIPANPMVTPQTIVPEWYFQPFYCILRGIPNKVIGVILFALAILILYALPLVGSANNKRSARYAPIRAIAFWIFAFNFLLQMYQGQCHVSEPYMTQSLLSSILYFSYFILLFIIT